MTERLDSHLDGELPADDLTVEERAQAAAFEARAGQLRDALTAGSPADMDARVMRRIAELGLEPLPAPHAGVVRRAWRGLWTAREIRLHWRPAYALAAAALLALVLGTPALRGPDPQVAVDTAGRNPAARLVGGPGAGVPIYVQFRVQVPGAHGVALAGSFSDWKPAYEMQQVAEGVWTIVLPITPGVHDYAFVVDGETWLPDPYAPQVADGFGGTNSRLTLLAPSTL